MQKLNSNKELGPVIQNITALLNRNVLLYGNKYVYQQKNSDDQYEGIVWNYLYNNINNIAYNLSEAGFSK